MRRCSRERRGTDHATFQQGRTATYHACDLRYGKFVKDHPKALREFLASWFQTLARTRDHKGETVETAPKVMRQEEVMLDNSFDVTMPVFSTANRFEPKHLGLLLHAFVEIAWLSAAPNMRTLCTERFLPHQRL